MHLEIKHGDATIISVPLSWARSQKALKADVVKAVNDGYAANRDVSILVSHDDTDLLHAWNPPVEIADLVVAYYRRAT